MIRFVVNGEDLDLFANQSIAFDVVNPLLTFNTIQGHGTVPFSVPASKKNARIFGWFSNQQIKESQKIFFCEKYIFGSIFETGFINIQFADAAQFQVYFSQNISEIFGDLQKTELNKLPLGSEARPGSFVASANHLTDKYALPTIENPHFYGGSIGFSNKVNDFSASTGPKTPMLFLKWLLEQIQTLTGTTIDGTFLPDADIKRLLFYNTFALDSATTIIYANHLPSITTEMLLLELKKAFNLSVEYNAKKKRLSLNFADNYFNAEPSIDWSDRIDANPNKLPFSNNRLEIIAALDSSDALTKTAHVDFAPYASTGTTEALQIKLAFSSLLTASSGQAQAEQEGITDQTKQGNKTFSPRLLFWNGIQSSIPTASIASGTYRLSPLGLKNSFYVNTENFLKNTYTTERTAYLSPADIVQFDPKQKVHINGVNYFVQKLSLQLGLQKAGRIKAKLLLCKI
jgi:hypothetical protein